MLTEKQKVTLAVGLFLFLVIISLGIYLEFAIENNYFTPSVGKPRNFTCTVNEQKTELQFVIDVCNPNIGTIPIKSKLINGKMEFNSEEFGKISLANDTNLTGRSLTPVNFTVQIKNNQLSECIKSHIQHDENSTSSIVVNLTPILEINDKIWFEGDNITFNNITLANISLDVNQSFLKPLDENLTGTALPCSEVPLIRIQSINSSWKDKMSEPMIRSNLSLFGLPLYPVPHSITVIGNKIDLAHINISNRYFCLHRREIAINSTTEIQWENLGQWWISHMNNGSTNLTLDFHFTFLGFDWNWEKNLDEFSFDPLKAMGGLKFNYSSDKEKVSNLDQVVSYIGFLWVFFTIFLTGIYIHGRKDIQPFIGETISKTVIIYAGWATIWLSFLWIIDRGLGISYQLFDGVSIALLLALILLAKDTIFDVILEKAGYLSGWKSWYPWFEHLPLVFFLVVLPGIIFLEDISILARAVALIDLIVDGTQDYLQRKEMR